MRTSIILEDINSLQDPVEKLRAIAECEGVLYELLHELNKIRNHTLKVVFTLKGLDGHPLSTSDNVGEAVPSRKQGESRSDGGLNP